MSVQTLPRKCLAIVLAAGEGVRMRSARPKVLHEIAGAPMLAHVLGALASAGAEAVAVVVGPDRADVAACARAACPGVEIFVQTERRGTAHAALAARQALARGYEDVLIAFADTPLVTPASFTGLRQALTGGAAVAVLGFEAADPAGYGRLLRTSDGALAGVREHKDASVAEREITLCNAGIMALAGDSALALLESVTPANAQNEFYLTDVVELSRANGLQAVYRTAPEREVMGVNDRVQLAAAEQIAQDRLREAAMRAGATLQAPQTVFFSHDTVLGRDVVVEPHVVFGPRVTIADNVVVHAFSHLEGADVAAGVSIGPFARLRPGACLGVGARIGNFVEIKASTIGEGAKVSHLSYIGDASVGAGANIGAGVVTCNYDGFDKFRTEIGAGAFVGTNSSLVAPVRLGAGAYIGTGSVVTADVAPDALALARGRQVEKPGWSKAFREAKQAARRARDADKS